MGKEEATSQALQEESRGIFQPGPGAVPGRAQSQHAPGQEACSLEHSWFFIRASLQAWSGQRNLCPPLSLLPCPPAKSPGCDFSSGSGFQSLLVLQPGMKTLETLDPHYLAQRLFPTPHLSSGSSPHLTCPQLPNSPDGPLRREKLKLRRVKQLAQPHAERRWRSQE